MKRTLSAALILGIVVAFATAALAQRAEFSYDKKRSFCSDNADLGLNACRADVAEEFYRAEAICINVPDYAERRDCRRDLREVRDEARDECDAIHESRLSVCELLGEGRYHPDFSPENFVHPDDVVTQNPWWPLERGRTIVARAGDEEVIVIHVTDRIKDVAGVPCRVVVDAAFQVERGDEDEKGGAVDYVIGEITDDWYAHHAVTGDVWYCGERVRNYEDGILENQDGSFEAGVDGAKGGILVPFAPAVGQAYRQEFAMDEAEDLARVVSLEGSTPEKGAGGFECDGDCLETYEFAPLEPDHAEIKLYLAGIGFVQAQAFEDGEFTGETEDLACVGDSLDVLDNPACGIEDVEALRDALCKVDPDTFCGD